ncbi:MAG: hypothetical protein LN588_03975 [Rickettsia endosymbiont of Bryobia graminum]|nr:hypothetical protein [Rickettsia endosymbiont of Bryobia graminum]
MTGYRKLEEFNTDKGEVSGGATGSKKVKGNDNQDYQFKPSIHHASIFRKARTGNLMNQPDTELFVELIASRVGVR